MLNHNSMRSTSSENLGSTTEERFVKSATGGYIPGPPISRQGSSRSDIPWYGPDGDDIDPRKIYRNHSRMSNRRHQSKSLSPSVSSSTLSSSVSSMIIDDPTSATSTTTLKTPTEAESPMVVAYNQIINTSLALYLRNSAAIGSLVNTQAAMVETLFMLQKQFLVSSCRGNVPNNGTGPSQAECITKIQKFAKTARASTTTIWITLPARLQRLVGWLSKNPADFIDKKYQGGHYYVYDIARNNGDSFTKAWINSWIELIEKLANYVEDYHKNGLKWYR